MIAAFNIMQTIDISKEVDVYETVFELRNIQPEIINNIVSSIEVVLHENRLKCEISL